MMSKTRIPVVPQHFYSLDAIRGIASIIVVLYHWQLFYYLDDIYVPGGYDKHVLPWYPYLSIFYENGVVAVDLFFLLSGFIFFWLYADRIASRKISFGKFLLFRLSRLYPIHFVSLIAVALLQWLMLKIYGHYFIILYNDTYHFILNFLFMQNWGFEKGASFNGPSWSVSVEVFLYLLFFLICWSKWQANSLLLVLLIPLGAVLQHYNLYIGKGMFSFFLGALVYYCYDWMVRQHKVRRYLPYLIGITVFLWAFMLVAYWLDVIYPLWLAAVKRFMPDMNSADYHANFHTFAHLLFRVTVSPCTILSLALWETGKGELSRYWSVLGNSSYAIYLLHFPLQIIFVLVLKLYGISRTVMYLPLTCLLFFAILIPISILAYYYFELPVEKMLRQALFRKRSTILT